MTTTPRFSLPLLAAAQAQKEVTHNEALTLIDALIHAAIEAGPQTEPPVEPGDGGCWLVGADAIDDWAGKEDMLAIRTAGGWRFVAPRTGMRVARLADGKWLRFDGTGWVEPMAITGPAGGSTIDSEARNVIAALILLLGAHGLLISG
ncbi:DUF2793 domain-containing protein [Sphingopyxis panaciterrae]